MEGSVILLSLDMAAPSTAAYVASFRLHVVPDRVSSIPYCEPKGGVKKSVENLGELLMGDLIENSPYQFHVNKNESIFLCITKPLDEHQVKLLKQLVRNLYQVNVILGNLPVIRFMQQSGQIIQWTGFPVSYTPSGSTEDYIINHLKFKVLVHEYEGSGVEILVFRRQSPDTDFLTVDGVEIVLSGIFYGRVNAVHGFGGFLTVRRLRKKTLHNYTAGCAYIGRKIHRWIRSNSSLL